MTQEEATKILQIGVNTFLTGQAGSGKTYTLNQFINWAREHRIGIAVTASTGIAATHLNGTTIHSWSGIGIKEEISEKDLEKLAKQKELIKRFKSTKILIIDEVSMLSSSFFDNLNLVCKHMKESSQPFGGMQIILCGDLFQLPPINKSLKKLAMVVHSKAWSEMKPAICYLKEQHRQESGDNLSLVLNKIRAGEVTSEDSVILKNRILDTKQEGITQLFSHNADVDLINEIELSKLNTKEKVFITEKAGKRALVESLIKTCLAPEELKLKVGAEVMFIKNDQSGRYANGTRGKVINFKEETGYPIVETNGGRIVIAEPDSWSIKDEKGQDIAVITQVPLRLAWAITIHKSQGMTLDSAFVNLERVFEYGMGYVALSRVKTLDGLHLSGFNEMSLKINPAIIKINNQLYNHSEQVAKRLSKLTKKELSKKIEQSIKLKGGVLKAERIENKAIDKKVGAKGQKDSHKTSVNLLLEDKSITEVAKLREVKEQTVIGHLARHIKESNKPKEELLKFKKFKPPTKQISLIKKILKGNKKLDHDSRYILKNLQTKARDNDLDLSYEELALA
ncbi:MAG TPA: AAA family ATPase, partial [Candidatus Saccharimonadales bacterium]|nr:AAA family ATPase [Candidatus Saccharimonadales bacterium]